MKLGEFPCPQCRKPASILAERCPACTTVWTKQQLATRRRGFAITWAAVIMLLLGLLYWLS